MGRLFACWDAMHLGYGNIECVLDGEAKPVGTPCTWAAVIT